MCSMGSEIRTSSAVGLAWTETETVFIIDDIGSHLETFSHKKNLVKLRFALAWRNNDQTR